MLFNFFVRDCPDVAQINLKYTDNFNLIESSPDVPSLGRKLTDHLTHISKWAEENKLKIAPEKCSVTLFTPNSDPEVYLDGVHIPVERKPKWLGFIVSNLFAPTPHLDNNKVKGNKRVQLMKAIRGQDWGDKETLNLTYKTLVASVLEYGAVIFFPLLGLRLRLFSDCKQS
jgi:hypothetical protein